MNGLSSRVGTQPYDGTWTGRSFALQGVACSAWSTWVEIKVESKCRILLLLANPGIKIIFRKIDHPYRASQPLNEGKEAKRHGTDELERRAQPESQTAPGQDNEASIADFK